MKVTVRKFDDNGNIVLESHDLRVADYITPQEGLFDMMQLVSEIIETRIEEPCEFVVSDYRRKDDLISRQDAIDALSQYPFEKVVNCVSIIEELPSAQPKRNGWVHIDDIYRLISGHSNYHGDNILADLTCLAEGKEVLKPITVLDTQPKLAL